MKTKKISGGSAQMAQSMLLVFFIPFILYLSYIIVTKNFTAEGCLFLLIVDIVAFFIVRNGFSYADIYISDKFLLLKKVFVNTSKPITEIKEIERAIMPFTYYIQFEDKTTVFFFSSTSDLFKQLISSDPNESLIVIREKLMRKNVS